MRGFRLLTKLISGEMCRMGRNGVSRRSAHRCSRPATLGATKWVIHTGTGLSLKFKNAHHDGPAHQTKYAAHAP
ncbi:Uncharacterised protein [Yersinia enterocolitica]|nr:Uncharacterised protein [Yersinia enterocolitica]